MRWLTRWRLTWRSLVHRQGVDDDLHAELEHFLEHRAKDCQAAGVSREEALREARRTMGSVTWVRDACHDVRGTRWIDDLIDDIRQSVRLIIRHGGFASLTVTLMATSIGISASAIAILDAVLLRALPAIAEPSQLALVSGVGPNDDRRGQSVPMYELLTQQREGTTSIFAYRNYGGLPATINGTTVPLRGIGVLGDYFQGLGSTPLLRGHAFNPNLDTPEAVISSGVWRDYFGSTDDIVGRPFTMGTVTFTVAGVMRPDFLGFQPDLRWDVLAPFTVLNRARGLTPAAARNQIVYTTVRLVAGVTPDQYAARLDAVWSTILQQTVPTGTTLDDWTTQRGPRVVVETLRKGQSFTLITTPGLPRALRLTAALSVMVFLASCVTLGLLVIARAVRYQRETAIRLALGGSRWRVVRPYLIESLNLSTIGCLVGLLLASWGSAWAAFYVPGDWQISLLPWGATSAVLMALLTVMTGALLALYVASRGSLRQVMHQTGPTTTGHVRMRTVLLTLQCIASVMLVYATLVYVDDVRRLMRVPVGLDAEHLHVFQLVGKLPYRSLDEAYFRQLLSSVEAMPGIDSVGLSVGAPPLAYLRDFMEPVETVSRGRTNAYVVCVFPGVFQTWRTPILAGRDVQWGEHPEALVTESLARRLYSLDRTLGAAIRTTAPRAHDYQITGVVANMAYNGPRLGTRDVLFVPCLQQIKPLPSNYTVAVYIRSSHRTLADLTPDVTTAVETLGVQYVLSKDDQATFGQYAVMQERLLATMSATFGAIVVGLTAVGLYVFFNYMLAFRSRELAVRSALGAQPVALVGTLFRELTTVLGVGIGVGLALALILHRSLQGTAVDLGPLGVSTPLRAIGILAIVVAAASARPAFRATRINVAEGLRFDE